MVYVGKREYKYGRMIMSHLIADSIEELHNFVDFIHVDRKHFQDKPGRPHYDICKKNKELAIFLGAKEICDKEIIKILKIYENRTNRH